MIICPGCGADMRFDPEKQKLVCDYCDRELDPKEYRAPKAAEASEHDGFYTATVFTCPQCGAEVLSTEETVATFCSYCGTSVLLEGRAAEQRKPDVLIPFKAGRRECEESYRKLVRRALFAPEDMKKDSTVERFRGIYMPYWIYSLETDEEFTVRGKTSERNGNYVVDSVYEIKSPVKASFDGISFDASSNFTDNLSKAIAPFYPKDDGVEFDPAYLSGFYADAGDVDAETYREDARDVAVDNIASQIQSGFNYSRYSVDRADLKKALHYSEASRSGLFPVWFMSLRNRKGDRISYAVVNGETGKATAEIPIDFKRYLIGALILAVPVFLLLNFFVSPTPSRMLLASVILGLVSLIISNRQLNRIYAREQFLDDKGMYAAEKRPKDKTEPVVVVRQTEKKSAGALWKVLKRIAQIAIWMVLFFLTALTVSAVDSGSEWFAAFLFAMCLIAGVIITRTVGRGFDRKAGIIQPAKKASGPARYKMPRLLKPVSAILITVGVLLANPVADYWYYGAAGLSFFLTAWSFYDIIQEQNLLTTRRLPQLNARGGDENV